MPGVHGGESEGCIDETVNISGQWNNSLWYFNGNCMMISISQKPHEYTAQIVKFSIRIFSKNQII